MSNQKCNISEKGKRESKGAEKDTRLQGRRGVESGGGEDCEVDRGEKNREQREDTCQHTPHKANVQGHETITDAKQESGNKQGERGGSGVWVVAAVHVNMHVQRPGH